MLCQRRYAELLHPLAVFLRYFGYVPYPVMCDAIIFSNDCSTAVTGVRFLSSLSIIERLHHMIRDTNLIKQSHLSRNGIGSRNAGLWRHFIWGSTRGRLELHAMVDINTGIVIAYTVTDDKEAIIHGFSSWSMRL